MTKKNPINKHIINILYEQMIAILYATNIIYSKKKDILTQKITETGTTWM